MMRTSPHHTATHPSPDPYERAHPNPYDELGALDDGPLEELAEEDTEEDTDEQGADRASGQEEDWVQPNHRQGGRRRRRGRFAGLPFALKAVVGLVVLAAFLTLADRWAVLYAEHRAGDALKDRMKLTAAPEVKIDGFPFLPQLVDGRLDSVQLTVPDVAAGRVTLAVTATAHDITLDGDGPTSVRGARVPELNGDALLSFADMNRELGASQLTFERADRDRILARGKLPVAGQDLRLRADVRVGRAGDQGIATTIGGMRLDVGDLATYRPGVRASEGLHLTPKSAAQLARETRKVRALLGVPSVVRRMGVPDATVREALRNDDKLAELTGSPGFVRQAMRVNLLDLALANPEVLDRLGFDPALLDSLSRLTRPVLADQLSLGFQLPELPQGELRLRDVRVEQDGIRVRLAGQGLAFGR